MSRRRQGNRQLTNPSALTRDRAQERYSRKRRQRERSRHVKGGLLAVAAVAVAVVAVAALYLGGIQGRLNQGLDGGLQGVLSTSDIKDPFYMLLLGTDKSKERAASAEFGDDPSAYRTDSMILARIDPATKHVTLVSIERDTLVDMGEHGRQKINAAYSIGGASYAVEVVSKFAGVPISHYAEINFDDFVGVVDKIGGIDVDIKIDLDDDYAGLHLKAGHQTIDGAQALALCRARHAYDAYGGGDYYRTANQRMVIGAILRKVLASDPLTLTGTVNELAGSVTTDLSLADIASLATSFKGFDMSRDLYSGLEPTTSKYIDGTWYETVDEEAWKTMMERVNQGLSPYSDASQDFTSAVAGGDHAISGDGSGSGDGSQQQATGGNVLVLNGAGVTGLAGNVASTLRNSGYTADAQSADSYDHATTEILFVGEENRARAEAIADLLGLSGSVSAAQGTYGDGTADVVVMLGADMAGTLQ